MGQAIMSNIVVTSRNGRNGTRTQFRATRTVPTALFRWSWIFSTFRRGICHQTINSHQHDCGTYLISFFVKSNQLLSIYLFFREITMYINFFRPIVPLPQTISIFWDVKLLYHSANLWWSWHQNHYLDIQNANLALTKWLQVSLNSVFKRTNFKCWNFIIFFVV